MKTIVQTNGFRKVYKKLSLNEKGVVDSAIRAVFLNPKVGQPKKGDLTGISVYKFRIGDQQKLLAYCYNLSQIVLVSLGNHQNFYKDLK